jgi:hypothetical protein
MELHDKAGNVKFKLSQFLSVKQIEEDIAFYSRVKINDSKMMDRLKLVLRYLESHGRKSN